MKRQPRTPAHRSNAPILTAAALERLALRYVERFATTRGKLADYLRRKLRERGSDEDLDPALIDTLTEKFAELGYIDDAVWAEGKAGSLTRRGYGPRRVAGALKAAGIAEDLATAVSPGEDAAWEAAQTYARKRKIGPYGDGEADRDTKRKQLAAMLRAGHGFEVARRVVEERNESEG